MARVQEMCDNGLCIQDGSVVSFPARLAFGVMKGFSYRVKVRTAIHSHLVSTATSCDITRNLQTLKPGQRKHECIARGRKAPASSPDAPLGWHEVQVDGEGPCSGKALAFERHGGSGHDKDGGDGRLRLSVLAALKKENILLSERASTGFGVKQSCAEWVYLVPEGSYWILLPRFSLWPGDAVKWGSSSQGWPYIWAVGAHLQGDPFGWVNRGYFFTVKGSALTTETESTWASHSGHLGSEDRLQGFQKEAPAPCLRPHGVSEDKPDRNPSRWLLLRNDAPGARLPAAFVAAIRLGSGPVVQHPLGLEAGEELTASSLACGGLRTAVAEFPLAGPTGLAGRGGAQQAGAPRLGSPALSPGSQKVDKLFLVRPSCGEKASGRRRCPPQLCGLLDPHLWWEERGGRGDEGDGERPLPPHHNPGPVAAGSQAVPMVMAPWDPEAPAAFEGPDVVTGLFCCNLPPTCPSADTRLQDKMAAKQPPPLMKKHSQTDLVSRLKTRKVLGVGGEDDDGEVHRSKISQVLGNEIKFAVREPLGLRVWQFASAVLFSGIAIMALAFPDQLYDAVFDGAQVTSKTPIRLYGGALLSISLIMWNALYTAEKVIIRWTLLTEACYFGVQFLVVTATLAETGLVSLGILLLLASRLLFVAISVYYYYQVGRKPKKV
ncbi:hypothetical protein PANDA_011313 [Ailuropoda melanoleuca]|uniref:Tumor protein p53-inducible protein 11 n=3 Tax=Ursidae TaxID=9632 RepID=D2HJ57_AILME|nr:hypothetical protein PANDA_011313 [Ailuropoda melanoleuca]